MPSELTSGMPNPPRRLAAKTRPDKHAARTGRELLTIVIRTMQDVSGIGAHGRDGFRLPQNTGQAHARQEGRGQGSVNRRILFSPRSQI